jgi:hypothetical protein
MTCTARYTWGPIMAEFITPEMTKTFIKMALFVIGGWSMASILFGKPGAAISDVMTSWGKDFPFIPVAWMTVMNVLGFHWFRW